MTEVIYLLKKGSDCDQNGFLVCRELVTILQIMPWSFCEMENDSSCINRLLPFPKKMTTIV